ncbi:hypothetical protein BgiBS90_036918, partial [Biomphalaria glabrata]
MFTGTYATTVMSNDKLKAGHEESRGGGSSGVLPATYSHILSIFVLGKKEASWSAPQ